MIIRLIQKFKNSPNRFIISKRTKKKKISRINSNLKRFKTEKYYDDKVPVAKRKFIKRANGPSNKVVADFP